MTKWLIETHKEVPLQIDDYVEGLEALLNQHIELLPIVNAEAATNPLEWCTGLLEGIAFIQSALFNSPNRATLILATLNLANIALVFNRSLVNGAYTQFGVPEITQPDTSTVHSISEPAPEIQGDSQELSQPAHDQLSGSVSNDGTASIGGND